MEFEHGFVSGQAVVRGQVTDRVLCHNQQDGGGEGGASKAHLTRS